jgi:DNA polymerase-3 subunit gamma/tau
VSYTVLAVKWRPKGFDELVGQAHVLTALVNSLEAGRLHHAYLFSGTRGVGKTTIARILAKAFNCERGVSSQPCGECGACVAIDQGRFVDLIEVDAASRTKVDDTRELLDNVQYMPTQGRFKIYLVDEVHMLSNHSFNALLKTLEEPPPHVKFLFATTDPQKLPVTVLSRCLQFNLKKLPLGLIERQLAKICAAEAVSADEGALRALARAADGSMRDALSLLDQGIAFGAGAIEETQTKAMLGTIDRGHVTRLVELLAAQSGAGILDEITSLDEMAPDYGAVLDEMLSVLQQVAIVQLVGPQRLDSDDAALAVVAKQVTPEDIQLFYQIALNGRRDMAICRDERMSFEMTMLRMLAFTVDSNSAPAQTNRQREQRSESVAVAPSRSGAATSGPRGDTPTTQPRTDADTAGSAEAVKRAGQTRIGELTNDASAPPTVVEDWPALVKAANLRGPVRSLAEHCELASSRPGRLELMLESDKADFNTEKLRARLQSALTEYLGSETKVRIEIGEHANATPAQLLKESESVRARQAREAIESDPTVRAVQAAFDAVLEPESIQPPSEKSSE